MSTPVAPVFIPQPNLANRPVGYKDAQGNLIPDSFSDEAFQGQYSGTNLIYKGFARPGSSTSAAVWQIAYLTYDGSNNLISVTWPQNANGVASNDYQFIWSSRSSYTYS
jgi:YD repeat-containing protein